MDVERLLSGAIFVAISSATVFVATPSTTATDLARDRPATASSFENEDHTPSCANDGVLTTGWTADDEPEGEADWWQVDLGAAFDVYACEVVWPYAGMNYRYRVDGSSDGSRWLPLSDQTQTRSRLRRQRVSLGDARGIRYVRITIIGFDAGCCAGISEVSVFGVDGSR